MKANLISILAAGLLGGFLAHYADVLSVHAQEIGQPAKEVRAERFVLVDSRNNIQGVFTFDPSDKSRWDASPAIKLFDSTGKEIFSAGGKIFRPAE